MRVKLGTYFDEESNHHDIEFGWESLNSLIVGYVNDTKVISFDYEDLMILSGGLKAVKRSRLTERFISKNQ